MLTRIVQTVGLLVLTGCGTTLHDLRVPLVDEPAAAATRTGAHVVIEDARADKERVAHFGKEIRSCERWFGDDTVVPSKLAFLAMRVSSWTRDDMQIRIRLRRFDIVEYCESVPVGEGTGAFQSGFTAAPVVGDTVVIRLAGEVNGLPFDLESRFDYATMYRFPNLPSSSPQYRAQLRARLEQLIKEIANIVWNAELARIEQTRN